MGIVPLVLRRYQEEFGVALLGKEHNVGCGWWSQALLSVLVCWERGAGTPPSQACCALHGMLVLPLLGLSDSFFFQVDGRVHHR